MTPLSGIPPDDKNTMSRVDNSRLEYFFRFLQGVLASSPSFKTAFGFFRFSALKEINLNTSYNIFGKCVLFSGISISGGFEALIFWRFFIFNSMLLFFMLFYTGLLSFVLNNM